MARLEYYCSIRDDHLAVGRLVPRPEPPQNLEISFKRTIRVPDNEELSQLPPDLGNFALYKVQDYADRLPRHMVDKKGVFFPMYQREAMWIEFSATSRFMIKIYCGGVNVVSGEHAAEGMETKQRRAKLLEEGELIQDYVVVPKQRWLDGLAIKPSVVRQFVAIPTGQGYTVEAQLTGQEVVGGLMLEITPALREPKDHGPLTIFIKFLTGDILTMRCSPDDEIGAIKDRMRDEHGCAPRDQHRLNFKGRQLEDGKTLEYYKIRTESTIFHFSGMRGGGPSMPVQVPSPCEQGIAAGGLIEQNIREDTYNPNEWVKGLTIPISVQILDSLTFRQVTGLDPPACPINAETYANAGHPFFNLYEENPNNVSGAEAFGALQSVNEIDMARGQADGPEPVVNPRVTLLHERSLGATLWDGESGDVFRIEDHDGLLSPGGPRRAFRTLADLEVEIEDLELGTESD